MLVQFYNVSRFIPRQALDDVSLKIIAVNLFLMGLMQAIDHNQMMFREEEPTRGQILSPVVSSMKPSDVPGRRGCSSGLSSWRKTI